MLAMLAITALFLSGKQLQAMENLADGVDRLAVDPLVLSGGNSSSCVPLGERQGAIKKIRNDIIRNIPITMKDCGKGMWHQIASLDMTDPQQQCPTGWSEYKNGSVRACGRPISSLLNCANISYTTGRQYSKVCGRVIGYQIGTPHGIFIAKVIDENYVDGMSITYGKNPRQHIWTNIAGLTENSTLTRRRNCHCSDFLGRKPPPFVGNNYYCESANPSDILNPGFLYSSDKLWDGQQCSKEGTCCTTKSPPWFSVELPNPTSDDIEVRICGDDNPDNEDFPIEILDIYIQ